MIKILNADDFFEAVNVDVVSLMNQDEVNAQLAIAAELYSASVAEAISSPGSKRAASQLDQLPRVAQAAAAEAAPPTHPLRGAALLALFGGDGAPDADGAARAPPPLFTSASALGTFPPTYSFDNGCALGTVRTLAATKLGDDSINSINRNNIINSNNCYYCYNSNNSNNRYKLQ